MNRLVRFGSFLNEELWIGADGMRVHRCGSQVRRRVAWVRAWPKNVRLARMEATRSMEGRVSYRIVSGGNQVKGDFKDEYTLLI